MKHVKPFEVFKDADLNENMDMNKVKIEQKDLKPLGKHLKNIDEALSWWLSFSDKYDNSDVVWDGPASLIMNDLNRLMRSLSKDQITKVSQLYKNGQKI